MSERCPHYVLEKGFASFQKRQCIQDKGHIGKCRTPKLFGYIEWAQKEQPEEQWKTGTLEELLKDLNDEGNDNAP